MKDLSSVTQKEQKAFLNSFDRILCDVDGVLWHFRELIPGALEAIKSLKQLGKKVTFVSNNSTKSPEMYFDQLKSAGFELEKEDLILPIMAIVSYLKNVNFPQFQEIYLVGMTAVRTELERAGFKIAEYPPDSVEESLPVFVKQCVAENDKIGAVVVDTDINLNYVRLQRAATYLKRPEVLFITGGMDARLVLGPKITVIGPGCFQNILEDMTGRKAHCLAKPSTNLNDYIKEKFAIEDPSRVLFIGDSVLEDMGFATNCGYQKLLALSGLTNKESVVDWVFPEEYRPHYYVDSLQNLYDIITRK